MRHVKPTGWTLVCLESGRWVRYPAYSPPAPLRITENRADHIFGRFAITHTRSGGTLRPAFHYLKDARRCLALLLKLDGWERDAEALKADAEFKRQVDAAYRMVGA